MNQQKTKIKTANEALEKSNLDWIAEEQQLLTASGKQVESHKAIIRTDNNNVIGVVGKGYRPVQNSEAFAFFDSICKDHDVEYLYAKALNGGHKVFIEARIGNGNGQAEIRKGDIIENRIKLINSFDGSSGLKVMHTPYRLICTNGMIAPASAMEKRVNLRHTQGIKEKYQDALILFDASVNAFQHFVEQSRILAQKTVDRAMVDRFLANLFPVKKNAENEESTKYKNKLERIKEYINSGKGNNGSTAWDVYNGVVEYLDFEGKKADEKRIQSNLFGNGAKVKEEAFEMAMIIK